MEDCDWFVKSQPFLLVTIDFAVLVEFHDRTFAVYLLRKITHHQYRYHDEKNRNGIHDKIKVSSGSEKTLS